MLMCSVLDGDAHSRPALLTWSRGQNEYGAGISGDVSFLPVVWLPAHWSHDCIVMGGLLITAPSVQYGDVAVCTGPLPRSWMKNQWNLQKQILGRYREPVTMHTGPPA